MPARTRERRTWADKQSIPTGIMGERWEGITICEANRATVYEFRPDGIRQLMDYCQKNYKLKGVNACVYGVDDGGDTEIKYAVFVQSGFLRRVPETEDLVKRRGLGRPKAKEETNRTK